MSVRSSFFHLTGPVFHLSARVRVAVVHPTAPILLRSLSGHVRCYPTTLPIFVYFVHSPDVCMLSSKLAPGPSFFFFIVLAYTEIYSSHGPAIPAFPPVSGHQSVLVRTVPSVVLALSSLFSFIFFDVIIVLAVGC